MLIYFSMHTARSATGPIGLENTRNALAVILLRICMIRGRSCARVFSKCHLIFEKYSILSDKSKKLELWLFDEQSSKVTHRSCCNDLYFQDILSAPLQNKRIYPYQLSQLKP